MRVGGLFEGYGGLTMAAQAVFGGELAWVSEYEPPSKATPRPTQAAARLLAHRHPEVPNLGDITAIDWPHVEPVDVLCGGFPCQDVSSAGKRVGMKPDSRSGLWAHFARAIAVLHPSVVLIENVRGLLSAEAACDVEPCPWCLGDQRERPLRALGAVLGDLAALGYDAQWTCVGADAVGAPHRRARVFILAWPVADPEAADARRGSGSRPDLRGAEGEEWDDGRTEPRDGPSAAPDAERLRLGAGRPARPREAQGGESRRDPAGCGVGASADATGDRRDEGWPGTDGDGGWAVVTSYSGPVADSDGNGFAGSAKRDEWSSARESAPRREDSARRVLDWGNYAGAVGRWAEALGRSAPAPTQTGKRGGQQLSPRFVQWMMGLPEGWVTDIPGLTRNEQLKLLGNGVVPQQAEYALRLLLDQVAASEVAA